MVTRNLSVPHRFVCITDDPAGIDSDIETKPMPFFDLPERMRFHPFRRMFIFREELFDLLGPTLHLDLDLVITGSLVPLWEFKPESNFVVAENWTQKGKGIGNMSVFRYHIGGLPHIWEKFSSAPDGMMETYGNSQTFVCRTLGAVDFFPANWCLSFKHSLLPPWPFNFFVSAHLPQDCKVVAFTGKPDIHDVLLDQWPESNPIKKIYKGCVCPQWLRDSWV
jgi:hypothetical protein